MQICLNDRQRSYSHPAKPLLRVLMVYFRADAWSPPPTARQGSARISGLSIPGRGLQGPRSAARSCFRLFKIVFSCNILPRAAAAAAGACQSSQMVWTSLLPALSHIPGVLPHGRHSERVLQGPGSCSSGISRNFPHARQWVQARDLAQRSFFQIGILPTHAALIKGKLPCVG